MILDEKIHPVIVKFKTDFRKLNYKFFTIYQENGEIFLALIGEFAILIKCFFHLHLTPCYCF